MELTLFSSPISSSDVIGDKNLILLTKTQLKPLLYYTCYSWFSAYRLETCQIIKGSRDITCLYHEYLISCIHLKCLDLHARYIQISLNRKSIFQWLYISICYFSLVHSSHSIRNNSESSYLNLYLEIFKFSLLGDIMLLRDSNAQTSTSQCHLYYISLDPFLFQEIDLNDLSLAQ